MSVKIAGKRVLIKMPTEMLAGIASTGIERGAYVRAAVSEMLAQPKIEHVPQPTTQPTTQPWSNNTGLLLAALIEKRGTERELSSRLGLSGAAVKMAADTLERQGLIHYPVGAGVMVATS